MASVGFAYMKTDYGQGDKDPPLPRLVNDGSNPPDTNHIYSAFEVITQFFGSVPEAELKMYIEASPAAYLHKLPFDNAARARLISCSYQKTITGVLQPVESSVVDFIYSGMLEVDTLHQPNCICKMDFILRYIMDLRISRREVFGPLIIPYDSNWRDPWNYADGFPADEYFIPYLKADEYNLAAIRMIVDLTPGFICKEEFLSPRLISGESLAERMGLLIEKVRFAEEEIMGRYYYNDCPVKLINKYGTVYTKMATRGSIMIDSKRCNTPAKRNITLCHECCHAFWNQWFFLLQGMTGNRQWTHYNRLVKQSNGTQKKGPIEWMEFQCDKITAYLLMTEWSVQSFMNDWTSKHKDWRSPECMRKLINALADYYNVTFHIAKYRLIELGYHAADGIAAYVDGHYVPDHGCSTEWPHGETYTIPVSSAAQLMANDPHFEALLRSGSYCFVENHLCLCDLRYVGKSGKILFMTKYGRSHMSECCLSFQVKKENARINEFHRGYVSRRVKRASSDWYLTSYELTSSIGTKLYEEQNAILAEDSLNWGELLYNMPTDFEDAVVMLMNLKGFTRESLASELGVDRRTLKRYLQEPRPALDKVIGICVALSVPVYISMKLIEQSGNALRKGERDHLFREFLLQSDKLSVERCEDILAARGMSPLFCRSDFMNRSYQ